MSVVKKVNYIESRKRLLEALYFLYPLWYYLDKSLFFKIKQKKEVKLKKIKVYVGCALTYASEDFKRDIGFLKNFLRSIKGVEVLEFIGLVNGTSVDVYEHDIHVCVEEGELIIAECSYPSTGLGWELGTSVEKHKKHVLAVAKADAKVTRLVLGAECARNPNFSFKTYNSLAELYDICAEKIKQVQNS